MLKTSVNPALQKHVLASLKTQRSAIKSQLHEDDNYRRLTQEQSIYQMSERDRKSINNVLRITINKVTGIPFDELEIAVNGLHATTTIGIRCTTETDLFDVFNYLDIDDLMEQVDNYVAEQAM